MSNPMPVFKKTASLVCAAAFFILALLIAITSLPVIEGAESEEYYFSGSLMDALSDSNGLTDTNYQVGWSSDSVRGYAIAGNYAYVSYTTGMLSKLDLKDGSEVKTVDTGVKSGADYVAVGGGLVLDPASGNVYDLDLSQKYRLGATSSQAYCFGGCWYIVKTNKECCCYPTADEDASDPANEQTEFWKSKFTFYIDGYTLPVSLAFNDGYLFYPGIGEEDTTMRILYCVDRNTGEQTDAFEMTQIKGTYWNSGFIYCDDGTVAVSTHWDNMYGQPRLGDDYLTMFKVDVDTDGKFVQSSARYISNGYNDSYCSCLVMVDGLGFAQTGLSFKVFDLSTGKVIASTDVDERLGKTYSNIAVAAGDDGYVRGYVSPAGVPSPLQPVDGLICFEYNKSTKEMRSFDLPVGKAVSDNTYSIKIGPDGQVLFAKNDGTLYCLTNAGGPPATEESNLPVIIVSAIVIVLVIGCAVLFLRKRSS